MTDKDFKGCSNLIHSRYSKYASYNLCHIVTIVPQKNPPTHFLQQTACFNKIIKLIIQVYSLNAISHEAELDGQFAKYGEIRIEPRYNERSQGKNYYNFILSYFFRVYFDKKMQTVLDG